MLASDSFDMDLSREDDMANETCTELDQLVHNPVVSEHKQAEPEHNKKHMYWVRMGISGCALILVVYMTVSLR